MAMNKAQFKIKLKQLRTKQGLSQQELADRMGCNRSTIWRYENGKINLSLKKYEKYAKVLGVRFSIALQRFGEYDLVDTKKKIEDTILSPNSVIITDHLDTDKIDLKEAKKLWKKYIKKHKETNGVDLIEDKKGNLVLR